MAVKNPSNSLGLTSAPGSLQAFYNKIGSNTTLSNDNFVNYINAPKFFEVSIQNIKPPIPDPPKPVEETDKSTETKSPLGAWWSSMKGSISSQWGEFTKSYSKDQIAKDQAKIKEREKKENGSIDTFLKFIEDNYNSNSSIIKTICEYISVDLDKDFKYYVQNITLPNIKIDTEYISNFTSTEPIGKDGIWVVPENNNISISLLDMAAPLHEYIFYPWLAEVGLSQWMYTTMPFTKADICISFMFPNYEVEGGGMLNSLFSAVANTISEGSGDSPLGRPSFQYIFKNCYPTRMDLLNPSNSPSDQFTRNIDFTFSHLIIKTSGVITLPAAKKFVGALGNRLINPLANRGLQPITGNSILPSTSL